MSQSEESGERSGRSGSRSEEEGDDESDEDDENSEDEADGLGPFRSVPCLHCRESAWDPREVERQEPENAIVRHGTHSYGYRCRRCKRVSWILGPAKLFMRSW